MERGNIRNLTEIELFEIAKKLNLDIVHGDILQDREDVEEEILDILFESENSLDMVYSYLTSEIYSYFGEFAKGKYADKELSKYFGREENIVLLIKNRTWLYTYWNTLNVKHYKNQYQDFKIILRLEKIKDHEFAIEEEIELDFDDSELSIYISDHNVRYRASLILLTSSGENVIAHSNIVKISDFGVKNSELYKNKPGILYESGIHLINDESFLLQNI